MRYIGSNYVTFMHNLNINYRFFLKPCLFEKQLYNILLQSVGAKNCNFFFNDMIEKKVNNKYYKTRENVILNILDIRY